MRITIRVTPAELADLGLWPAACEVLGLSDRALTAAEADAAIMLSGAQAERIGLITVYSGPVPAPARENQR